jgi:hypothetical protein
MTMEDKVATTLSRPRLYAVLLTTFAAFRADDCRRRLVRRVVLTVALRAREIGVRTALGARALDIVGLVLKQSMGIALTGVSAGVLASMWLTRALQGLCLVVTSHDLVTFVGVTALLLVVTGASRRSLPRDGRPRSIRSRLCGHSASSSSPSNPAASRARSRSTFVVDRETRQRRQLDGRFTRGFFPLIRHDPDRRAAGRASSTTKNG